MKQTRLPVILSAAKDLRRRAALHARTGDPSLRSGWHLVAGW